MLITIIVLQSLVNVWHERRQRRVARLSLQQLTEADPTDADCKRNEASPFLRAVLARYRKDVSLLEIKRARTRKAVRRLSRISEQKQARYSAPRVNRPQRSAR
jgi:hypothetical protein